jgi:hypothetical protein
MKVDMSSRAVTLRLRRTSQLRRLCLALGKSRPVSMEGASDTGQSQSHQVQEPEAIRRPRQPRQE